MQVILELVAAFDGTADVVQAQLRGKALEKEIAGVKKALFIQKDAGTLRKIHRYFPIFLIVKIRLFFCFAFRPCHHLILVTIELSNEVVKFPQFFIDVG